MIAGGWWMVGAALAGEPGAIVRTAPATLPALRVEAGSAAVVVQADPTLDRSRIEITPERWAPTCTVAFGGEAALAVVRVLHGPSPAGLGCRSRITITLAGDTDLLLDINAADLSLSPIPGHLDIQMEIGGVEGTIGAAGASLRAAQAQVNLWDVAGPVNADVQIGAVQVRYGQPLLSASRISSDIGVIRVEVPTPVHVRAQPGAGGYHNSLAPVAPDTTGALDLRTRLGSIYVTPAGLPASADPL